ncbi:protein-disulfide reductase DsbD domain-containing protein [Paracoccus marinaquae]|uniref:Thiol:disulfide interchange protein DsbD N-terminal domain-containing protein n=1 Tax=Paracoccus marinaquae TaxID=2841926 RepID=A0ABS6AME7_9RHOB|nr:protein-disulfide reductase DsbD domain-containing protein [Paracoccus marinaquae]MBU3031042.1 hypothetical protein [Paracoccus marinaquae]
MRRIVLLALFLPLTATAEPLSPGLQSARLLPGWTDAEGNRVAALELRLEPGWKTYWRQPGDSGLPPSFDWSGSQNLADVTFHWPAPEAIRSGDALTLGYHDTLLLPFTARPRDPAQALVLDAAVDFGLCENICVPARVSLQAPAPAASRDPRIEAALADVPARLDARPACRLSEIADGMRLSVDLPQAGAEVAAMEVIGRPEIWVSTSELEARSGGSRATADFVPPAAAPFDLDTGAVRITLIGPDGAVEMQGCDRQG